MSPRKMKKTSLKPSARRAGFTLIEMLIVIAIIGILAAILFPVFSRARQAAQRTTCASNMKQLGMAFLQYVQDNNGRYPGGGNYQQWAGGVNGSGLATPMTQNTGHWMTGGPENGSPQNYSDKGLAENTGDKNGDTVTGFDYVSGKVAMPEKTGLFQYVKSTAVYMCPSTEDAEEKHLSYSMNCALTGVKDTKIQAPTEIVLLVDEGKSLNDGWFWATNKAGSTDILTTGHLNGGNLLFVDGHVKFYSFEDFTLDAKPTGLANKSRMTGIPRFHDRGLGSPTGSSYPTAFSDAPKGDKPGNDGCGEPATAAAVPPGTA